MQFEAFFRFAFEIKINVLKYTYRMLYCVSVIASKQFTEIMLRELYK